MKKQTLLFLALAAVFMLSSCKKDAETALVSFVGGDAFIVSESGKTQLKTGDSVNSGTKIETGLRSFVDITFRENVIRILENTVVDVEKITADKNTGGSEVGLFVSIGEVFSNVGRKLGKFDSYKIATPTAVAAVRGTDFLVSALDGSSIIACLNGRISVTESGNESKSVDLTGGNEILFVSGKPFELRELSEENKGKMNGVLGGLKSSRHSMPDSKRVDSKAIARAETAPDYERENVSARSEARPDSERENASARSEARPDSERKNASARSEARPDSGRVKASARVPAGKSDKKTSSEAKGKTSSAVKQGGKASFSPESVFRENQ